MSWQGADSLHGPVDPPIIAVTRPVPAWRRRTEGEARWPVALAIVVAIVSQALLPDRLGIQPRWLVPGLEAALLVGLTLFNPVRMKRDHVVARWASRTLTVLMTLANGISAILLIRAILTGQGATNAAVLFASGAAIYVTNIVAFGLWYWELDRNGPFARAAGLHPHPDFLFPQMASPDVTHPDWEPYFVDYLYVSFTNATAFSPTDTMPMARWAKCLMAMQSAIALSTLALVVSRAVNILHPPG